MILTSLTQWKQWAREYANLPYVRKYPLGQDRIASWEPFWRRAGDASFVLESGKGGRYTYVGIAPVSTVTGKGARARVIEYETRRRDSDGAPAIRQAKDVDGPPLEIIKNWLAPYRSPRVQGAPSFIGGCVGFLGYDVVRFFERLPELAEDDLKLPDYSFVMVRELWVVDHAENALYCAVHRTLGEGGTGGTPEGADRRSGEREETIARIYREAAEEAERMKALWDRIAAETEADEHARRRNGLFAGASQADGLRIDVESIDRLETAFPKERFMEAVRQIQRYIEQGDVFQVNLSVRQSRRLERSAEDIYEWLRLLNPSPYMGLLRFPGFQLVSGSPELLVRAVGGIVETRPIAGTRPRGRDEREDRKLADELISNEKERAEHIMLVDLLRNDLGRVSRYGTVKVTDLMVIETYSHVMHIVSHVRGSLAEGKDAFDVIAAVFPGGTITGAPKIRTMEIIEELEPVRRGPYTGSIGWIDYNGDMELNIIIRTLVVRDGVGHVQAGAGIVIDSDPEKEYYESLNKAKALWKAIQFSESVRS